MYINKILLVVVLNLLFRETRCHLNHFVVPQNTWEGVLEKELFQVSDILQFGKPLVEPDDYLINTPGCYIPNYARNFQYNYTKTRGVTSSNACGARAVHVEKLNEKRITFRVNEDKMTKYTQGEKYKCCYKFIVHNITSVGKENFTRSGFTKCVHFKPGASAELQQEVITVSCILTRSQKEIYFDAYILLKRRQNSRLPPRKYLAWNVMLLGLDSMSRTRLTDTMPKTYRYLKKHKWLDYRGYQKVEYNSFPNLMALLTGKNSSTLYAKCKASLDKCSEYFIWNQYMRLGYTTAYGEDNLAAADTFSKFESFRNLPTHHHMRPFFRLGENRRWNVLCTRRKASATHLLEYALDFASTYRKEPFFGMFWINSYSRSPTDNPSMLDQELAQWFTKIKITGVLENTFIVFFSDHGTRYGEMRIPIESFYDERLPMLFMWVPQTFKKLYPSKYTNLELNQHRLVTPYDLYMTLADVLRLTQHSHQGVLTKADGCRQCSSLFHLSSLRRTCSDVQASEKWCSCRKIMSLKNSSPETEKSIIAIGGYFKNKTRSIKTFPCMTCAAITLQNVIRSHIFQNNDVVYHIIAFQMSHDVNFEAIVAYRGDSFKVISVESITAHNKKGLCVLNPMNRPFCDCVPTNC